MRYVFLSLVVLMKNLCCEIEVNVGWRMDNGLEARHAEAIYRWLPGESTECLSVLVSCVNSQCVVYSRSIEAS